LTIQGRRHQEHDFPLRYAARDLVDSEGRIQPQHAIWSGWSYPPGIVWVNHPEGGYMKPFTGPDEAWDEITADSTPWEKLSANV